MTTHHTPGELKLRIKVRSGLVELRTRGGEETTVEIEPMDNSDASLEAAGSASQELNGDTLSIDVPHSNKLLRRSAKVRVSVVAPPGVSLRASTASADVDAGGELGGFEVETASGDVRAGVVGEDAHVRSASGRITVEEVYGSASLHSVSGDVSVRKVGGRLDTKLVSGDLRIGEAAAAVSANTVSGDITIESAGLGETTVKAVSGDITVGVARGARVYLDVSSLSGDTTSQLDAADAPASGEGDAHKLKASSTSGDVHIRRAAPIAAG
jgi:DUF4097 and DUF4098 domain-containing protein YvlB